MLEPVSGVKRNHKKNKGLEIVFIFGFWHLDLQGGLHSCFFVICMFVSLCGPLAYRLQCSPP